MGKYKIITTEKSLKYCFPEIAKEWHPTKNGDLIPEMVPKCYTKKIWWLCKKCNYEWECSVHNRTKHKGNCPACVGQVVTKHNCLETNFPEIAKEWHSTKNGDLTPKSITKSSRKRVWWKCHICDHEWISYVCNRTSNSNKNNCPSCAGQVVTKYNCLETNFPEIAKEWHPTKNGDLTPKDFVKHSNKKVWWKCFKCGHEWKTVISARTGKRKQKCPKCSRSPISKSGSKWLDEMNVSIEYREYLIKINNKRFKVDGYNPLTKTIYEYFGNYWHGNPEKFLPQDIHPKRKIPYGQIYIETLKRVQLFEENGYRVIYKWGD